MGLIVLPALIPDIPAVYDSYFAAFKGDLILEVLFPSGIDAAFRAAHTAHTIDWWHKTELQHTLKCIDTETGAIIGMAIWDVYWRERSEDEWMLSDKGVTWLEGKEKERAEGLLMPLWEKREKLWGGRKYICK